MSYHDSTAACLKELLRHDETGERRALEQEITQAQCDLRCLRCASLLMIVLISVAVVGLAYAAVLLEDFPIRMGQFIDHIIVKGFFVLGLASVASLLAFAGLSVGYRRKLEHRQVAGLQFAAKLMASRLDKPPTPPLRDGAEVEAGGGAVRIAAAVDGG
jgi:hypothetical protein